MYFHWWVLLILFILTGITHSKKSVKKNGRFRRLSVDVAHNPKYLYNYQIFVKQDSIALDIDIGVARELDQHLWAIVGVTTWSSMETIKEQRTLAHFEFNVCDLVRRRFQDKFNLLGAWVRNYWSHSNLPKTCPITKGDYQWRGLKPDKASVPPFIPSGKYRFYINLFFKDKSVKESISNLTMVNEFK